MSSKCNICTRLIAVSPRCLSTKVTKGELSITPDCRKTLVFFIKSQETYSLNAVLRVHGWRPQSNSRPAQRATQALQSAPVCHDSIHGHQVSYQRFLENRWIPDSLPTSPRPRRKPPHVEPTLLKVKRNLPSMSFYESHRRQPTITRFARLNKQRSGDLSLFRSAPKS